MHLRGRNWLAFVSGPEGTQKAREQARIVQSEVEKDACHAIAVQSRRCLVKKERRVRRGGDG